MQIRSGALKQFLFKVNETSLRSLHTSDGRARRRSSRGIRGGTGAEHTSVGRDLLHPLSRFASGRVPLFRQGLVPRAVLVDALESPQLHFTPAMRKFVLQVALHSAPSSRRCPRLPRRVRLVRDEGRGVSD